MTEVVDGFAQNVATELLVHGNLGHRKVGLRQFLALGVDSLENLLHPLNFKGLIEFDNTDLVVLDFL